MYRPGLTIVLPVNLKWFFGDFMGGLLSPVGGIACEETRTMADEVQDPNISANVDDQGNQHGVVEFGKLPAAKPAPNAQMVSDARKLAADVVRSVAGGLAAQIDAEMQKLETTHPLIRNLMSTLGSCKSFLLDHVGQVEGL